MKVGSEEKFGAGYNVLPTWKKRLDAKTLVTTPNSDVIYAMSYVNLGKDGPIVFEAPPQLQGILLDFWQTPIPVDGGKSGPITEHLRSLRRDRDGTSQLLPVLPEGPSLTLRPSFWRARPVPDGVCH